MLEADYDVVVVGSGFGGSVTALRLTEKGYRVGVLEAGPRWNPEDFPPTNWRVWKYLWWPRLGWRGIQRLTLLDDVLVLSGAGVGGGSLVYANTLYSPPHEFYRDTQWSDITDWERELAPYYERARRMLGAAPVPFDTPADEVIRKIAAHFGVSETFHRPEVSVFFGEPGVEVPDPYFGGVGPPRCGCIACGGCMVGCRFHAKNTLDHNYLWLAEHAGAVIHAEHEVMDLEHDDGGWVVTTRRPGRRRIRGRFTSRQVVLAAGALGTTRLLLDLHRRGRLPGLSDQVGNLTRTNSEAILGATTPDTTTDYSRGVAITSSIHPDAVTHIEPVHYPAGSNVMGLLGTVLTDGGPGLPRQIRFLGQVVRHPLRFVRSLSVRRWSERTVILLVMQTLNNSIRLRLSGRGRLRSEPGHGAPNPSYIPVANEAARAAAQAMGGFPGSAINEVLADIPTTAHIIGGAVIGADRTGGVIDPFHRVYGEPGLSVVDGAAVPANLGVNPSLTITALAERAMAAWPNRGDADPRPALGETYRAVEEVAPVRPIS